MSNHILIITERKGSELRRVTLEAITAAKKLSASGDYELHMLLIGHANDINLQKLAHDLFHYGAHHVYVAEHEQFEPYQAMNVLSTIEQIVHNIKPQYILLGHTANGRDLAPRLASRLSVGYISDVIEIETSEENENVSFIRPLYAGKAFEKRQFQGVPPYVVTIRPNNNEPAEYIEDIARSEQPIIVTPKQPITINSVVEQVVKRVSTGIDLTEAEIIVAGGRGVKGPEGFTLLQTLADELGGTIGASRAACDAGYCDYALQIGQTGKVVTPKLYIACGISGAIQHLAGMSQSRTIVAINKDAEAPIFSIADYGIVGDLFEVVPLLIEQLKANR